MAETWRSASSGEEWHFVKASDLGPKQAGNWCSSTKHIINGYIYNHLDIFSNCNNMYISVIIYIYTHVLFRFMHAHVIHSMSALKQHWKRTTAASRPRTMHLIIAVARHGCLKRGCLKRLWADLELNKKKQYFTSKRMWLTIKHGDVTNKNRDLASKVFRNVVNMTGEMVLEPHFSNEQWIVEALKMEYPQFMAIFNGQMRF